MSEWQPIETAPKDGRRILVSEANYVDSIGCAYWSYSKEWKEEGWYSSACCDDITMFFPTHWMPLPPPPTED